MPALAFVLWKQQKKGLVENRSKSDDVLASKSSNIFLLILSTVFSLVFVVGELMIMHGLASAAGML